MAKAAKRAAATPDLSWEGNESLTGETASQRAAPNPVSICWFKLFGIAVMAVRCLLSRQIYSRNSVKCMAGATENISNLVSDQFFDFCSSWAKVFARIELFW